MGTPHQVCPLLLLGPHHRCLSAGYILWSFLYPYHHSRGLDALLGFVFLSIFTPHTSEGERFLAIKFVTKIASSS